MLKSPPGFHTFLSIWYTDIALSQQLTHQHRGKGLSSQRKQNIHNLLGSTQQTYEIIMWRLFTRRVRFIILAQI